MNESAIAHAAVRDFATAVRAHLDDLPPDEVDDLTDGLEADLMERARDAGDNFGDPASYAEELRLSSGLPARSHPRREPLGQQLRREVNSLLDSVRSHPTGAQAVDFFISLRPVWWVIRGWILYHLIAVPIGLATPLLPSSLIGMLCFGAIVVLSVQWGRGRWLSQRWLVLTKTIASVVAAIALLPLLTAVWTLVPTHSTTTEYVQEEIPSGLVLDGGEVTNIFAFDCAGNPLADVQLFTRDGDPLTVTAPETTWTYDYVDGDEPIALVPNPKVTGGSGWNVFPLNQVDEPTSDQPDLSTMTSVPPPFPLAQPLSDTDGTCAASALDEPIPPVDEPLPPVDEPLPPVDEPPAPVEEPVVDAE
ncbi:HAAS signaling domain-containing protein [Mycetocola zhujimingii]|uniref:HAAS signaling domain-containing protein n=1 Tax=Mycetocola zhujimingii TaxID=2079792 RepID=UPI000D37F20E|nr:hypothetical protein [Mycetocola zhujimingii]AWB85880.1 hypothetical protein C3E77_04130 [Mycetocola zhujimingii]